MRRVALGLALAVGAVGAAPTPGLAQATPLPGAADDYVLNCSGCHGPTGAGVPGTTPSLRVLGPLGAAPGGRAYLGRVPGVAQAPLDDARLARLLNWVLAELAGAPPEPPYDAAEIRALRREPLRDTRAARAALAVPSR